MARLAPVADAPAIAAVWAAAQPAIAAFWPEPVAPADTDLTPQLSMDHLRFYITDTADGFFRVTLGATPPGRDGPWEEMDLWALTPGLPRARYISRLWELFNAWFADAVTRGNMCWGTLPESVTPSRSLEFLRAGDRFPEREHPDKPGWRIWEPDPARGPL